MFNRSIAFFITAITLYTGGAPLAQANLLGMPMSLGSSVKTLMKARTAGPAILASCLQTTCFRDR
jgi:hypothetical protein